MIKKNFQKYFAGAFFLNVPLVINTIIALITLPIILTNLPIVDYGKWQFMLILQMWISAFSAKNITAASKRGISKGLNGTFLYGILARLKLLLPVGILVLGISFYLKITRKEFFSVLLAVIGLYLIFGYLFQKSFFEFLIAKKRFKEWSFWKILFSIISLTGSTLIAFYTKNVIYFAIFQLGSISILSWIVILPLFKKEKIIESYKKGEIDKECVYYGLKLVPVDLISTAAGKLSHFIIGTYFGFANLAVFSVANKLRDKNAGIIKSIHPLFYADFTKIERKKLVKIINRYLLKIGIMGFLLTFGFIVVGCFYIKIFLPDSYYQATIYFAILSLGLPPVALSIILHTILESHLRYKELSVVRVFPNLVKIILIIIFGYLWQMIGVSIALALNGWVSFGFYYLLTIKKDIVIGIVKGFPLLKKLSKF